MKENQKKFLEICKYIKENSKNDCDFKGNFTSSYDYTFKGVNLKMWEGDVEISKTLLFKGEKVGSYYSCWDREIKFDVNKNLFNEILVIFNGDKNDTLKTIA